MQFVLYGVIAIVALAIVDTVFINGDMRRRIRGHEPRDGDDYLPPDMR